MAINGRALTLVCAGSVIAWSGIKGWSVSATIADVVSGRKPQQPVTVGLVDPDAPAGTSPSGGATGSAIADAAMGHVGHSYRFGGSPGVDASKPWDCSSFVNYVIGVQLNSAIPGYGPGKYRGNVHGPTTASWAIWPGTTRISRAEIRAGDIIVWAGHMGIAISNGEYVSALNPNAGTKVTPITPHVNGPIVRIGRYGG